MSWALWSLGTAVLYGLTTQVNRYWQLPGYLLTRWRNLMPALIVLPALLFVPPPADPLFYVAAFISSLLVPIHDIRVFDLTRHHGGAVVLRLRSLALPLVFLMWLVLDSKYLGDLFAIPLLGAGILLCVGLSSYFLFQLKHCAISRSAMKQMLPVIATGAIFDIANKTAMDHAAFPQNAVYYIFLVSGLPVIYMLAAHGFKMKDFVGEMASVARKGASLGAVWVIMMLCKNLAMMATPNPAYVTAIALTAPFWASLLMRFRGEKEEADWVSGTAMVLCIIALAVLSGFVPHS